jgi:hypothetical protein
LKSDKKYHNKTIGTMSIVESKLFGVQGTSMGTQGGGDIGHLPFLPEK